MVLGAAVTLGMLGPFNKGHTWVKEQKIISSFRLEIFKQSCNLSSNLLHCVFTQPSSTRDDYVISPPYENSYLNHHSLDKIHSGCRMFKPQRTCVDNRDSELELQKSLLKPTAKIIIGSQSSVYATARYMVAK